VDQWLDSLARAVATSQSRREALEKFGGSLQQRLLRERDV